MTTSAAAGSTPELAVRNWLLALLAAYDAVVLAVSGGPDSVALMHLVADWKAQRAERLPDVVVATVDHAVRDGSAMEALQVGVWAGTRGLPHQCLTNVGTKPDAPFSQAWARGVRYRLLEEFALQRATTRPDARSIAIVTAHHRDDQAETVLMRLARGTGIDGLGAIRPRVTIKEAGQGQAQLDLVRPFLSLPKTALRAYLDEQGHCWIEDPSNSLERFERVRLRQRSEARAELGLDDARLALTAMRAQRATDALDALFWREVDTACTGRQLILSPLGFARIERDWFVTLPTELRMRLMSRLLQVIGGSARPLSLGALESAAEQFLGDQIGRQGFSLAGALVDMKGQRILLMREAQDARNPLRLMHLSAGQRIIWDNRFEMSAPEWMEQGMEIGPLLPEGLAELEDQGWRRPHDVPASVLWCQPAARSMNTVYSVPTLQYQRLATEFQSCRAEFLWSRLRSPPSGSR